MLPGMTRWPGKVLPRAFFDRDPVEVAPQLLNKLLCGADGRVGRIVEVEAYRGADDPAAHTYNGKTARNATMFGPPGHLYVYFTYGMHWCANTVCSGEGVGAGILMRALQPLHGLERMRQARAKARRDRDLCSGPARLAQAMGITGSDDGTDLVARGSRLVVADDDTPAPARPLVGPRVGISRAVALPWRWRVADSTYVSR